MPSVVWAVVVARVANGAKSRLASALDPAERRALAVAMLADVVTACAAAPDVLNGVVAVVDDPEAAATAEAAGALAIYDTRPNDMNAAASRGLACAARNGAGAAILLPGDIPLLSHSDLRTIVAAARDADRAVVIGASRDGQGTNALFLRPVDAIAPAFGPPSVDRHVALAHAAGAQTVVLADLDLSLDIDTPADLSVLARRRVGLHTTSVLHHLLAATR